MCSDSCDLSGAILRLSKLYIKTPEHNYALQQLCNAVDLHMQTKGPVGFIVTGPSRSGKSRTIMELESYIKENYVGNDPHVKPVIVTDVPSDCTRKGLARALLTAGGDPFASRGSTRQDIDERVKGLVVNRGVIAVVLDELHHLFEGKSDKEIIRGLQAIKWYYNNLGIVIILTGMPSIINIFMASDEVSGRFSNAANLPTYTINDIKGMHSFKFILKEIWNVVPMDKECNPDDDSNILRWSLATNGVFGRIITLTENACILASKKSDGRVNMKHIAEAHAMSLTHITGQANPFILSDREIRELAVKTLDREKRSRKALPPKPWFEFADE